MDLSIVILNYNTCDHLRVCLKTLASADVASAEFFVVDNASSDDSADMVARDTCTR